MYVNNDHAKFFSLEFVKLSSEHIVNNFTFAENMVCRISSIIVFKAPIERKLGEIFTYFNQGLQNTKEIKNFQIILENLLPKLFLILIPQRSYEDSFSLDLVNNYIFKFQEQSGYIFKSRQFSKASLFGGVQSILPFFYLLRFCNQDQFP